MDYVNFEFNSRWQQFFVRLFDQWEELVGFFFNLKLYFFGDIDYKKKKKTFVEVMMTRNKFEILEVCFE